MAHKIELIKMYSTTAWFCLLNSQKNLSEVSNEGCSCIACSAVSTFNSAMIAYVQ